MTEPVSVGHGAEPKARNLPSGSFGTTRRLERYDQLNSIHPPTGPHHSAIPSKTLDEMRISPAELAELSGLTEDEVLGLLFGDRPLSHRTALGLEAAVGEPVVFSLRREAKYREGQSL